MKRKKTLRSLKDLSPKWTLPIPSGTQPVRVQSVYPVDHQTLQWNFTSGVSSAPPNVPQFLASGDGSNFQSPTGVTAVGNAVQATYAGAAFSPGCVYSVTAPPTGVTFAAGTLSVPQTGAVISEEEASEIAATEAPASLKLAAAKTRTAKARKLKSSIKSAKPARRAA